VLLPALTADTQREVNFLRDMAGLGFINGPPLRQPHHSSSIAALMGGTAKATPVEISMAQGGVLFLDELTEFPRPVLSRLR
jgi:magnesium chelatase family protein